MVFGNVKKNGDGSGALFTLFPLLYCKHTPDIRMSREHGPPFSSRLFIMTSTKTILKNYFGIFKLDVAVGLHIKFKTQPKTVSHNIGK